MKAPLILKQPKNWQDFETLCKELWGEIWKCPEIKKNGRAGQVQHGVDIYGIPFGETKYYGIQCKGKDVYTGRQFTETEISTEVEKAKLFQPPLKKLYFATTALKDVKIEEFVRQKNIDNTANGFFELHIFSWEDIVELIEKNKQTHAWYSDNDLRKPLKKQAKVVADFLKELKGIKVHLSKIDNSEFPIGYHFTPSKANFTSKSIDPLLDFPIIIDTKNFFEGLENLLKIRNEINMPVELMAKTKPFPDLTLNAKNVNIPTEVVLVTFNEFSIPKKKFNLKERLSIGYKVVSKLELIVNNKGEPIKVRELIGCLEQSLIAATEWLEKHTGDTINA